MLGLVLVLEDSVGVFEDDCHVGDFGIACVYGEAGVEYCLERGRGKVSVSVPFQRNVVMIITEKGETIFGMTDHSIPETCGTLDGSVDSLVECFTSSIALAGRLIEKYAMHRNAGIGARFGPLGVHRHVVQDCLHIPFPVAGQDVANGLHVREGIQLREFPDVIGFRESIGARTTPRVHDDGEVDIGIGSEPSVR